MDNIKEKKKMTIKESIKDTSSIAIVIIITIGVLALGLYLLNGGQWCAEVEGTWYCMGGLI